MKTRIERCLMAGLLAMLCLAVPGLVRGADKASAADDGWLSLIPAEGDQLTGWTAPEKQPEHWKLVDGVIIGDNPKKKGSDLWTEKEFGDYELIVEYRTESEDYDSGVFLHGSSHQVQIGISRSLKADLTACLYCPKDGNGKYPQQPRDKIKEVHKLGDWNTLRMVTRGKQIKTYLNGELINDYTAVKYPEKGRIGLQLHSGVHQKMAFRVVKIKELAGAE